MGLGAQHYAGLGRSGFFGPPPHLHARDLRCREGWARNPVLKLVTLNFRFDNDVIDVMQVAQRTLPY